jgi:hypothetical protein
MYVALDTNSYHPLIIIPRLPNPLFLPPDRGEIERGLEV